MSSTDMPEVDEFITALNAIAQATTDSWEASSAADSARRLKGGTPPSLEAGLKKARDELFHYKGPLYDSTDQREEMKGLREAAWSASKTAINACIRQRR